MKGKSEDARLNLRLPRELLVRLKIECVKRNTTMAAAAKDALRAWLRKGADR